MDQLPDQKTESKHLTLTFIYGVIFFVLITGITVSLTVVLFKNPPSSKSKVTVADQEKMKTASTSATLEKDTVNRSEWTFEILNGTATPSAEQKVVDKVKGRGYTVIKQAKADKPTYKMTELYVAESMQGKADMLLKDLQDFVKVASISGVIKDSTASARIIVGSFE